MDPVIGGLIAMQAVGGGIKTLADLFDNTGAKEAELTRQAANLKLSALEETMRRAEGQQTQVLSSTKARMAATGFSSDSKSFTNYLTGMAQEFQKQNDYARQSGMASIDLMRDAADVQGSSAAHILAGVNDLLGTGAGIISKLKPTG